MFWPHCTEKHNTTSVTSLFLLPLEKCVLCIFLSALGRSRSQMVLELANVMDVAIIRSHIQPFAETTLPYHAIFERQRRYWVCEELTYGKRWTLPRYWNTEAAQTMGTSIALKFAEMTQKNVLVIAIVLCFFIYDARKSFGTPMRNKVLSQKRERERKFICQ